MTTLIGVSGSLRRGSFNSALLRAAAEQMPPDAELLIHTIRGIPLYDGDDEQLRNLMHGFTAFARRHGGKG